ncbi:hypothetical protein J9317_03265 [Metabacillus sp. KIGAM252]|uniref:Uncharacterized protein n=1 Tax=Metabacillus flavus TaxID=2823519 RepID=A0ABS5LAQ1_9BACI|nr:hypothetical protein [Metabacillus flavus]MBS2967794.1 hypothetical protein [Metabacillus flavus]
MGNIPIKPLVDSIKTHGPKVGKFVKDNWQVLGTGITLATKAGKKINDHNNNKKESKQKQGKIPYRKVRFIQYKTEILHDLGNKKRSELFQYKLEVSQFIQQINNEEQNEVILKKPLHTKRVSDWNEILIQIEDKMKTKDYQEYLMIYNNPTHKSPYFEGFDVHLDKFNTLVNKENTQLLYKFLQLNTGRSIEEIKRDFA